MENILIAWRLLLMWGIFAPASALEPTFDIAADSGACGIVPFGAGNGVRCAGDTTQPVVGIGEVDGFYPLTLNPTTCGWDDGDNTVWTISFDGSTVEPLCEIACSYDGCAVRVGSDCSLPTFVVSWGDNGGGQSLGHGATGTDPAFVVDEAGFPIRATAIDAQHGAWVAVVGSQQQIGGWGACGTTSMDCGGFTAGAMSWLPVNDASAIFGAGPPTISGVWTIGTSSIATTDNSHFITGTSSGDRRETLQQSNDPALTDFYEYTEGVYSTSSLFTEEIQFASGGNEAWCLVTTEGDVYTGGDSRGSNKSLFATVTADGRELDLAYDGSTDPAVSCAYGYGVGYIVTSAGDIIVAGKNTSYVMTDAYSTSFSTTTTTLPEISGYWGAVHVVAQAYGACALYVMSATDTEGDVLCWGGTTELGTFDYGEAPTLFIAGVVVP